MARMSEKTVKKPGHSKATGERKTTGRAAARRATDETSRPPQTVTENLPLCLMCKQRRLTAADLKEQRGYCAECGDSSCRVGKWSLEENLKQRYPSTYGNYRLNSTDEGFRVRRLLDQLVHAGQVDRATFDQTPVKAMIEWLLDHRMLTKDVNRVLHLSWEDAEALLRSEVVYLQEQAAPTRSMGPADSEVEAVNAGELSSSVEPPASASTEPRSVMRSIEFYRRILLQDAEDAQLELTRACHNLPDGAYPETLSHSIRQRLRIPRCADKSSPRDATATAWHPFILEYCETLGVPSEEVDRLYRRIMGGDLMDSRGLARETKLAKERLDQAFELAESQWHEGDSAIHRGVDEALGGDSLERSSGIDGEKEPERPSKALSMGVAHAEESIAKDRSNDVQSRTREPSIGAHEPDPRQTFRVNVERGYVLVPNDPDPIPISKEEMVTYLNALSLLERNVWMSDSQFRKLHPEVESFRPDQHRKKLPPQVLSLLETGGNGTRIRPEFMRHR